MTVTVRTVLYCSSLIIIARGMTLTRLFPLALETEALVFAWNATNVTLAGGGTIDGNGAEWWRGCASDLSKPPCDGHARPHLVFLSSVSDVSVRDLTFENSPDCELGGRSGEGGREGGRDGGRDGGRE